MPLILDAGRVPPRWAARKSSLSATSVKSQAPVDSVRLALINNMPDAALEDTEMQFFQLLESAAGDIPVSLKLYSLPKLPRGDRARQHLATFYAGIDDLWSRRFDGVIVTGTEPRQPNLRDEPYWPALVDVLDWAEHNTISTVLSCLAAHAGVLYSDGIDRHPRRDKQFGVFHYRKVGDHALIAGTPEVIRIPHSRWNELREDALTSRGYLVLTQSAEAGVDLFVKKKGRSLFVHFQGHPEYEPHTLFKEYRRDVRRFLRGERKTYPSMPHDYFDAARAQLFAAFREKALADRREEVFAAFPDGVNAETMESAWRPSALCIYRNWLQYVASRKVEISEFAGVARSGRVALSAQRMRGEDAG